MCHHYFCRSSRPEVFCEKDVLRNFAKFTGKHLCQSLFFNKIAGLRPATLLKNRLWHRCFPVNFAKFPRTTFLTEHLRWLLLLLQELIIDFAVFKYCGGKLLLCEDMVDSHGFERMWKFKCETDSCESNKLTL